MDKLHPGARWLFRVRSYFAWGIFGLFFTIQIFRIFSSIYGELDSGFILGVVFYFLFVFVTAEIYARMKYNRYLYEVTDDGVKIERGIIWKKYVSIPYQRVQNVDIKRGIIARMFGFSTVDIETAGHSGFGGGSFFRFGARRGFGGRRQRYESEGHLMAIDVDLAEKIRDFVMKKVRETHDSGI